jgi:diguanylate cyclase (GGDEF)-like protein
MKQVLSLDPPDLVPFLERRRANPDQLDREMDLAENLVEVLRKANEFVPSEAGSILLDDPRRKHSDRRQNLLTFVAAFGGSSEALLGHTISANKGIAGHVYLSGRAYYTSDVTADPHFDGRIDHETRYLTRSIVAIPIRIGVDVCGVLELLNREGATGYAPEDRNLLEIFAGYISRAIQNVLDGRLAQEFARRDNLTGLFNDRHLHLALDHEVGECLGREDDLAMLFLDLDFFKSINDTYGHLAGSQVLREVGRLLSSQLAATRAVVARYGGDEFVIAVPGLDERRAVTLAEQLRQEIVQAVFCAHPGDICPDVLDLTGLTCSIGVATLRRLAPEGGSRADLKSRLLRAADTAMYRAKETGRNRVVAASEEPAFTARALTPPKGA